MLRPVLRASLALVLLAPFLCAGTASAQTGARLTGAEIARLVNGKQVIFRGSKLAMRGPLQEPEYFIRSDGVVADIVLVFREDRSYRRRCTRRAGDGSSSPCAGAGGTVGTGIRRIDADTLCLGEVIAFGREICYAVERAGSKYRCRYVSGGLAKGPIRGLYDGIEFELTP